MNPFDRDKFKQRMGSADPQNPVGGNLDVFNADQTILQKTKNQQPVYTRVSELPRYRYIPEGATSLDFRRLCKVTVGTTHESFMRFVAPPGAITRFIAYGIYSDAQFCDNVEFFPTVDGTRVFGYHGDPNNNFKICLGLAPDLSNNSLIECQIGLNPGQVFEWFVTNAGVGAADTFLGIRMQGYFDNSSKRYSPKFGG